MKGQPTWVEVFRKLAQAADESSWNTRTINCVEARTILEDWDNLVKIIKVVADSEPIGINGHCAYCHWCNGHLGAIGPKCPWSAAREFLEKLERS